ncbi:amino acid adenylation domain-containing protein [Streptacidiphilus sp. P02-A3a]|uniref:non-ribosomal peptide synthetase n=1 Tax=Streptacidiphilus sp. P02-A3a TaxID=2704468 RepID=UPI0015FAF188|nr:amino acid adenylation domain-containing protein [Streptacidiphilus sp. P02-A3a]QMU71311.1 amino acid adenylation domain-containing protein [Streptacidiphilus sp. P02-A3a]
MTGLYRAVRARVPSDAAADTGRRLRDAGVVLRVEDGALRYTAPPGALTDELRAAVRACRAELLELLTGADPDPDPDPFPGRDAGGAPRFAADPDGHARPFPLTDLQQAYLVGEQDFYQQPAPAVFVHEYAFAAGTAPAPERLRAALRLLRRAQGVLRLAVALDGSQRVLPADELSADGCGPLLDRHDLRGQSVEAAERRSRALRARLTADLPPLDAGRPFLLRYIALPGGGVRLQVALRLIAFDAVTTQLFFAELGRCCADPGHRPGSTALTFRDYVLGLREHRATQAYRDARCYWEQRLDSLPVAPALPAAVRAGGGPHPDTALRRIDNRLDRAAWLRFREHAAAAGLPPGTALLGLFVESLQRWSGGAAGLLTVLARHRPGDHPELPRVWGNASTTVLLGYRPARPGDSLAGLCRDLRSRLFQDLAATAVSGVEVGRLLHGRGGVPGNPAPVVFTSGIDEVADAPAGFLLPLPGAELAYSAVSTPQVLLDHQVYAEDGELVCNFDFAEDAYPVGTIERLRDYHRSRLRELAADPAAWERVGAAPLPSAQTAERRAANDTRTPLPSGELHSFVLDSCRADPAAVAVVDDRGQLTRGELDAASGRLARRLRRLGVGADPAAPELVGVRVGRGRGQSVAVLAVLRAGGAYLPIDPGWPVARVRAVLAHSGARALVGPDWPQAAEALPQGVPLVPLDPAGPDREPAGPDGVGGPVGRTAYVIYTSGSTGTPKGVVIPHAGAVNTLRDLTARFALGPEDRVLAVSSLAFDLSVFDQFGLLGAGGAVVAPADSAHPDPQGWAECAHRNRVTVWNSVPALLQLTLEFLGDERARELLATLRLVLLSGDWVPPVLVARLARICPDARVLALGGATEASIWSNWYPAASTPDGWTSVPYGWPLANQTMRVLDQALADVPDWVPGDLYIGGSGLASGYLHDPERTAGAFLEHPGTGERLYRTGDRARYRPGGVLEFLGRADHQVKINGYRVELGEIEARLAALPGIDAGVAVLDTAGGAPALVAFVTRTGAPADPGGRPGRRAADESELRARLRERLPHYMVPAAVFELDRLPLSGNGKVDRSALLALTASGPDPAAPAAPGPDAPGPDADRAARTPGELRLLELWRELLGPRVRGVADDFFGLGGDSLTAVRLFHRIEREFGRRLPLASLFTDSTVRAQAALLADGCPDRADDAGPLVGIGGSGPQRLVLVHPVGGDVLCYREVAARLGGLPVTVHGLRARGLRPGETPAPGVDAMAEDYARALAALPDGPLHLVGWSMGGTVALRLAETLERQGRPVASLTTVDAFTGAGADPGEVRTADRLAGFFTDLAAGADLGPLVRAACADLPDAPDAEQLAAARRALPAAGRLDPTLPEADLARLFAVYRSHSETLARHTARSWAPAAAADRPAPCLLLRATATPADAFPGLRPLDEALPGLGPVLRVDADHYAVVRGDGARLLADRVAEVVAAAAGAAGNDAEPVGNDAEQGSEG